AAAMRVNLRLPAGLIMSIGGLTYPLYLLHQHIGYMLFNYFSGSAPPGVLIGIVTVVMLVGAWIVWRFIERPAQRLTKKLLTHVVVYIAAARLTNFGLRVARGCEVTSLAPHGLPFNQTIRPSRRGAPKA